MNKRELKERFQREGIPECYYNLDGVGRKDERLCLEYSNGEWHVYYLERGIRTSDDVFPSEEAACEYIYKEIVEWL